MLPSPTRRALFAGAAAIATAGSATAPAAAAAVKRHRRPEDAQATLQWLGTAGWRVDVDGHVVLVDPYLTRFPTGLAAGRFDPDTRLRSDPEAVAPHVEDADTVLVTHTHWDHVADVPLVARTTGAQVFGTLTTYQVLTALGVPPGQVSTVEGGEVLQRGPLVLRVVSARHSRNARGGVLFPGLLTQAPTTPETIADLPEGGTLAYCLDLPGGRRCLFLGASDFSEKDLAGLAPDLVAVPVPSSDATHDYLPRLLSVLDHPRTVVPVHWDDFESPLRNPPQPLDDTTRERLDELMEQVGRVSPRSRVVLPRYAEPLDW